MRWAPEGFMEFIKQNRVAVATVVVILAIIGVIWLNQRQSDDTKKQEEAKTSQEASEKKQAEDKAKQDKQKQAKATRDYHYTATAGDSYTVFARQSVQAYASANDVPLSKAQIIAAETMLTQKAHAPLLDIGDAVTMKHGNLKQAVQFAQKLSKTQQAAWQHYVPYVSFS